MSASSDRLDDMFKHYTYYPFQYPDVNDMTQLLSDVTDEERMRILQTHDPLNTAAAFNHTEFTMPILSSLPQHQRLDALLLDIDTLLHWAAGNGKADMVETILTHLTPRQQQQIMNAKNRQGFRPADYAVSRGHQVTATLLQDYQHRAEEYMAATSHYDHSDPQVSLLSMKLTQTQIKVEDQAHDIQTLTDVVSELVAGMAALQAEVNLVKSTSDLATSPVISGMNDRHDMMREDVDRIDETVGVHGSCLNSLTETVDRIDGQFYPDSNTGGRGQPYDGGDNHVIEEGWVTEQPVFDADL